MAVYLSRDTVRTWADSKTWQEGRRIFARRGVTGLVLADPVQAVVQAGGHAVRTRFRILPDGTVDSGCPCRRNQESGIICEHVIAAGFAVADATEDTRRERRRRIEARMAAERVPPPARAGENAAVSLRLRLAADWAEQVAEGIVTLDCQLDAGGKRRRVDKVPGGGHAVDLSPSDRYLLYVLEDLTQTTRCPGTVALETESFLELLAELSPGCLWVAGEGEPLQVSDAPTLPCLQVTLDPDGRLRVIHVTEPSGPVIVSGRKSVWIRSGRTLQPVAAVLPPALRPAEAGPLLIPRRRVLHVLDHELPALEDRFLVDCAVDRGTFTVTTGQPAFAVDIAGTTERLALRLLACYDGNRLPVGDTSVRWLPAAGGPRHYLARDATAEASAADMFRTIVGDAVDGAPGTAVIAGMAATLQTLAETVPALRKHGWDIRFEGDAAVIGEQAEWVYPSVTIVATDDPEQFQIETGYIDRDGRCLDGAAVETALRTGQSFITAAGRLLLIDSGPLNAVLTALAECSARQDGVALVHRIHAGFLSGMLDTIEGARVQADPVWGRHAAEQRRQALDERIVFDEPLQSLLRPYQRDGIAWLRFCERCGYSGILADEMGLGKTVQALAWIRQARLDPGLQGRPVLVVCPTSLVHNWEREAARFVPTLTRHVVSGPGRHREWEAITRSDLVFTSYALLRRDIERYRGTRFAIAILDEAQHIKNRSTLNAIAAKRIEARHRLVLTGTPIENSVSDLWSIMDFLQPGYLGSHGRFKVRFERPIAGGGAGAAQALDVLRRKMEPFMLRRLKQTVAADLPPKVTRVATCRMTRNQQRQYDRLVSRYHDSLAELVDEQGFSRARFSVFTALLRLRQMCCHPELLRDPMIDPATPSAKVDLFFELLDEAIDGGHRVLVFSQFVRMLQILRRELERRGVAYAYLDGSTRDRMARVDTFNNSPEIPVFLVSLKAGGSGLNLTGADIVIHFDPWWNPAVEDQATDRAHRIGQTRTVYNIKLITEGTIEEKVLALQARKRDVIEAAVSSAGGFEAQLTWRDVQDLMGADTSN